MDKVSIREQLLEKALEEHKKYVLELQKMTPAEIIEKCYETVIANVNTYHNIFQLSFMR